MLLFMGVLHSLYYTLITFPLLYDFRLFQKEKIALPRSDLCKVRIQCQGFPRKKFGFCSIDGAGQRKQGQGPVFC